MERNGNNDVDRLRFEESAAALGHEPAERLSKRYFTAVFEALDHAAERMLLAFVGRVACPRARARKMRRPLDARAAEMIVAARIEKRPPADRADRAVDHPHALAAIVAEAIVRGESRGAGEGGGRGGKNNKQAAARPPRIPRARRKPRRGRSGGAAYKDNRAAARAAPRSSANAACRILRPRQNSKRPSVTLLSGTCPSSRPARQDRTSRGWSARRRSPCPRGAARPCRCRRR